MTYDDWKTTEPIDHSLWFCAHCGAPCEEPHSSEDPLCDECIELDERGELAEIEERELERERYEHDRYYSRSRGL